MEASVAMATIVREGRDPWWTPLAVNILGGLWNDWQQRERNKKEAAYLGELERMRSEMTGNTGLEQGTQPPQDNGQGLLNTSIPEGYNNNGWANAFHKTDTPLTQFDLGTAGLVSTTGNTAPVTPANAWTNALGNSGNPLPQFNAGGTTPTQPQGTNGVPIVTPMDFYNAAMRLAGTKRFGMISPDRIQALLTPYMKANEEAWRQKMRDNVADQYMNATDGAGRVRAVTGSMIRGITPESMANIVFNQNKPTPTQFDLGGQIVYGTTDGMSGMFNENGRFDRTLTPQEIATNAYNNAKLQADIDQNRAQMAYNYASLNQQGMAVSHIQTDANGVTWIIRQNGTRERFDGQGLTAQEKAEFESGTKRLSEIDAAISAEETHLSNWQKLLNEATSEADKEAIRQEMARIRENIAEYRRQQTAINNRLGVIANSRNTGGQAQPTNGQPTTETPLPPTGQAAPPNGNTVIPLPPAVPPIVQNTTNAIQHLERLRAILSVADDEPVFRRKSDGKIFTGKMVRKIIDRANSGEFRKQGVNSGEEVLNWLVNQHGFEPTTNVVYNAKNKIKNRLTRLETPQTENMATTTPQTPSPNSNLNNLDVLEASNIPVNLNGTANNWSISDFLPTLGATPAYADENISSNNTTLATDTNTEAGIQRALDELNGQFGEQRWQDWATGLDLNNIVSNINNRLDTRQDMIRTLPGVPIDNPGIRNLPDLPRNQPPSVVPYGQINSYAPIGGMDLFNRDLRDATNPFRNVTPIPNAPIDAPNNGEMVLLGNRQKRPQQVLSGYYFGDTRNGGQYTSIINKHAKAHNVDPDLIAAMIQQESSGNSRAVSSKGAGGLMQLMPKTARGLGVTDVFDPDQNIAGGTKYIAQLLRQYKGNVEKALWAYNAGPGNVKKGRLPEETRKYIPSVMARYRRLKGIATGNPSTPKGTTRRRRRARSRRRR